MRLYMKIWLFIGLECTCIHFFTVRVKIKEKNIKKKSAHYMKLEGKLSKFQILITMIELRFLSSANMRARDDSF